MNYKSIAMAINHRGDILPHTCNYYISQVEEYCQANVLKWDRIKELGGTIQSFYLVPITEPTEHDFDLIIGVAVEIKKEKPSRSLIYKLPAPSRHDGLKDVVIKHTKNRPEQLGQCTYGFYTESGRFLNRTDAQKLAIKNGQISVIELKEIADHNQTELQSPNVW